MTRLIDVMTEPGSRSTGWKVLMVWPIEGVNHRVSAMDDPKLTAIGRYLQVEFFHHTVHCFEDPACGGWLFRIDDNQRCPIHWLLASNDYLKNQTVEAIDDYLRQHQVGQKLMAVAPALLRLMNEGPRIG
jgi:hypothetical protein